MIFLEFGSSTSEQEKKNFGKSRETRMMETRAGEEHSGGQDGNGEEEKGDNV